MYTEVFVFSQRKRIQLGLETSPGRRHLQHGVERSEGQIDGDNGGNESWRDEGSERWGSILCSYRSSHERMTECLYSSGAISMQSLPNCSQVAGCAIHTLYGPTLAVVFNTWNVVWTIAKKTTMKLINRLI